MVRLTPRQKDAMRVLDDSVHDKILMYGGSGSGKSYVAAYKIIRDCLRFGAPSLIAREKYTDLAQGMIDQIVPSILQSIARANGHAGPWTTWRVGGKFKFAAWAEKKTKLIFCNGSYIRFAGLSKRDVSESGSDRILSPSWFHILVEEASESEWSTIELLITRLRYNVLGVKNKLLMTMNPPSINHWSYKRFIEKKREDGSPLSFAEISCQTHMMLRPQDNEANLGKAYITNLSQLTGANRARFYDGTFQDSETGVIFKRMNWTTNLPRPQDWDRLVLYVDPTPLTGKAYSMYADYKSAVLCGLFGEDTFVLDVRLVRGSTLDMLNAIKQLWDASPNKSLTEVWMEKKGVPSDFSQVMAQFSTMVSWSVPIQWDTRIFGEKKAAIETFLQPLFETGHIYFNAAFRDTERGKQVEQQILKFSRKANKFIHDDVPDAIMRADTKLKGKVRRKRFTNAKTLIQLVTPAYIVGGKTVIR